MLARIERRQVKAKDLDLPDQRGQPPTRQSFRRCSPAGCAR
jgi:hypothetical protein